MSLTRQAAALGISRGSLYYRPRPVGTEDLALVRRIDELHLDYPFAGSRMLKGLLRQEGFEAGREACGDADEADGHPGAVSQAEHVETGARTQDLPLLLRKLAVTRPNQVWAMDITCIPMARGFVYLVAVAGWFSRKVLAWRPSVTLETEPCPEALKDAIARFGAPKIMNADQGSQFTSINFITALKDAGIRISMDGKGHLAGQCLR